MQSVRQKICTLDELAQVAENAKGDGKSVVLCHGVFDLVHMGHVRHFEAARREGDVLMVTVTADAFVNKGPGRPVFPDALRAEMISSIQYVDYVAVNHAPTAETVLQTVKPGVYVKGADYEDPEDDVTGNIRRECEFVERNGGRVVFTRDITFSSSSLINRHLNIYNGPLKEYLDGMRSGDSLSEVLTLIDKVADMRVLMIGEAIVDEYQYVTAMGKSAKENMIATRFRESELFAGGVIAAANHVATFCKEVEILTVLGMLDSREELIRKNLKPNVRLTPLHRDGAPTTRKCRFIEPSYVQKLFEVYFFDDSPMNAQLEAALVDLISEKAPDFDLVICADFGHGLLSPVTIDTLVRHARFLAVNTQTNSANIGYNLISRYPRADYVCIDAPEAQLACGDRFSEIEDLITDTLSGKIRCPRFAITHGKRGCVTYDGTDHPKRIPAFTESVVDTVGAGDAFFAVTAPLAAAGGSMRHIGFVGNAAGAMKVKIVGHRESIEKAALVKYITALLK